ncbi:MAG: hypothetical protein ACRCUY_01595, partial [Thermoguttaceae bacterium]
AVETLRNAGIEPAENSTVLLVSLGRVEVDVILLQGDQIRSMRSFRLPEKISFSENQDRIAAEIKRTLAAAPDDSETDSSPPTIYIFAAENEIASLVEQLRADSHDVSVIDPFSMQKVQCANRPELPGRFAPLLGAIFEASSPSLLSKHAKIDFLRPKEAPKPTNYLRIIVLLILLVSIIGYGIFLWNQSVVSGMEEKQAALEKEYAQVAARYNEIRPKWSVLQEAQNWDSRGVAWLDDLRELSVVLPDRDDLVITQMAFTTGPINNNPQIAGMIQLEGMVRDPIVLRTLQNQLQITGKYQMRFPSPSVNPAGGGYPWLFRTSIFCLKR